MIELHANEYQDAEKLLRCQKCRTWFPVSDIVKTSGGVVIKNAFCDRQDVSWQPTGEFDKDVFGRDNPIMRKVTMPSCNWGGDVFVSERKDEEAEGGTLEINVHEDIKSGDRFGG